MHCVGRLLVGVLKIILQELGCRVDVNHQQSNGVDIHVFVDKRRVIVLEVVNWNITCRLYETRRENIIANLSQHEKCHKIFLYTNPLSKNQLGKIEERGIHLIQLGFQILRQPCYEFFQEKSWVTGRKIFTNSVKAEIRSKILEYLDNEYYAIKNLRFLFT